MKNSQVIRASSRRNGFSLVELLLALAIMMIIGLAMTVLVQSQNDALKTLGSRISRSELGVLIASIYADNSVCSFQFVNQNGLSFIPGAGGVPFVAQFTNPLTAIYASASSTANPIVSVGQIYGGDASLTVASIDLTNILQTTPTMYMGDLNVKWDFSKQKSPLKPSSLKMLFTTTAGGVVTGCTSAASQSPSPTPTGTPTITTVSCPPGQVLTGIAAGGTAVCTNSLYQDTGTCTITCTPSFAGVTVPVVGNGGTSIPYTCNYPSCSVVATGAGGITTTASTIHVQSCSSTTTGANLGLNYPGTNCPTQLSCTGSCTTSNPVWP